jgi:t-SNARE complex subunit (syntaxin)
MMVHEHQIMIERIDSHAEAALFNLDKGRIEIVKSYENVTSYKNLGIKVFLVLVLFFTFYVVFLL